MVQAKMTELMRQYRLDFLAVDPRQQGVEEDDALVAPDAGEIGVAVRRAAGAVHDEHAAASGKAAALEERLDALLERGIGQRGKAIEERRDEARSCPCQRQHSAQPHEPTPHPPPCTGPLHEREECEHQGSAQRQPEHEPLGKIGGKERRRHAIEPEARFDAKCSPQGER